MAYCPRCDRPLLDSANDSLRCDEHGAFFPANALRREIPIPKNGRGVETIACPRCQTRMRQVLVDAPDVEPVHLDVCPQCESWWLDTGEIERLRGAMLAVAERRRYLAAGMLLGAIGDF